MKYRSILFFVIFFAVVGLLTAVPMIKIDSFGHALFVENLIINEVDYDQGVQDGTEFIEITNTGTSSANLDAYNIRLVNGENGSIYSTISLPDVDLPVGAYYVLCSNSAAVINCDQEIGVLIQDGSPDAVALFLVNLPVDTVSYEGNSPAPYTETSATEVIDDGVGIQSISRYPNQIDTDNNNDDFSARCITPGLPNIAQNSDCDELLTPELEVTLTAVPGSVPEPGGTTTLTVRIDNLSILNISLTSLSDNDGQNLDGAGTCQIGQTLSGFGGYQCEYPVEVAGDFEDMIVRSVTAVGEDDFSVSTSDTGQTTVTISERIHWERFLPVLTSPLLFAEPNDTCAEAYAVLLNVNNLFKAEDAEDWYFFNLNAPTNLQVSLLNFVPAGGNLSVWSGSCGNLTRIGNDGSTAVNRTINLGTQPAGHYLIWLITDPPFNDSDLYNLRVNSP